MAKLNWDKANAEKRAERHGRTGNPMLEMPVSWNDVISSLVPPDLQRQMKEYAWAVIAADLKQAELPSVPVTLMPFIKPHIDRKGGVLQFAV